jgi:hypothetical protein
LLGSFRAALDAAAELPGALQDRVTAKGCYSELPQLLLDAGAKGAALAAIRQDTAHEVLMDEGDLCVFDPMLSHQGSPFRAGVRHATGTSRHALFSVWADDAAIGVRIPSPRLGPLGTVLGPQENQFFDD